MFSTFELVSSTFEYKFITFEHRFLKGLAIYPLGFNDFS